MRTLNHHIEGAENKIGDGPEFFPAQFYGFGSSLRIIKSNKTIALGVHNERIYNSSPTRGEKWAKLFAFGGAGKASNVDFAASHGQRERDFLAF